MLRDSISRLDYQDNASFADLLLYPMLRLGVRVTIVSGFIPTYLTQTLQRLLEEQTKFSGELKFILCLPAVPHGEDLLPAIAGHLATESRVEAGTMFRLYDQLRTLGSRVEIHLLVPSRGSVITRSAIGVFEDSEAESNRVGFIDELAGDDNSLIHLSRSWVEQEAELANRFEDLAYAAANDSWSAVSRLVEFDVNRLSDFIDSAPVGIHQLVNDSSASNSGSQPEFSMPVQSSGDDDEIGDDDFDQLLELVELSDGEIDQVFEAFYGDPQQTADLWTLARSRGTDRWARRHAAPAGPEIIKLVGDVTTQCWCGNDYSIRYGCTNSFDE